MLTLARSGSAASLCSLFGNWYPMSRLAKKGIKLDQGVTVEVANGVVKVKGPKGELTRTAPATLSVTTEEGILFPAVAVAYEGDAEAAKLVGTWSSHIANMVEGVTKGFSKKLQIEGVGYRVEMKGKDLVFALGFSHPVPVAVPAGITVVTEKGALTVSGIDKDLVGSFAAQIRALKKPEPYKGKGIRYEGEVVRMKEGKKSA